MGNMGAVYQLDDDPEISGEEQDLNEQVLRVEPDPQGIHPNGLAHIPPISGNINIPVLSLHTIGDLFVPFLMQQIYAEKVSIQGKSDLLVQRAIRDIGHCGFNAAEQELAFADLVNWVVNDVKPDGDDVLDPDVVADSDFGCNFTIGLHPCIPPFFCVPECE
jgi:hypothetical protein